MSTKNTLFSTRCVPIFLGGRVKFRQGKKKRKEKVYFSEITFYVPKIAFNAKMNFALWTNKLLIHHTFTGFFVLFFVSQIETRCDFCQLIFFRSRFFLLFVFSLFFRLIENVCVLERRASEQTCDNKTKTLEVYKMQLFFLSPALHTLFSRELLWTVIKRTFWTLWSHHMFRVHRVHIYSRMQPATQVL